MHHTGKQRLAERSLSARRAWIEIICLRESNSARAWIEMHTGGSGLPLPSSLSARRAWIEIKEEEKDFPGSVVALRKESVDRNNISRITALLAFRVALRKESVDRNVPAIRVTGDFDQSLSARRAWIEIPLLGSV